MLGEIERRQRYRRLPWQAKPSESVEQIAHGIHYQHQPAHDTCYTASSTPACAALWPKPLHCGDRCRA